MCKQPQPKKVSPSLLVKSFVWEDNILISQNSSWSKIDTLISRLVLALLGGRGLLEGGVGMERLINGALRFGLVLWLFSLY